MSTTTTMAELPGLVGTELGTSEWYEVTQEHVNLFADATGDHQWIHVDPERATKESPFGGPIAHGYLTLSLLVPLFGGVLRVTDTVMGVNYGLNKVRFPSPVPVGSSSIPTPCSIRPGIPWEGRAWERRATSKAASTGSADFTYSTGR